MPTLLGERRRPRSALAQPRRAARRPLFLRPVRPLGDRVHSQFLEASVQLHVHGVERVQAAPVLYVSAGGEGTQGSGQLRGPKGAGSTTSPNTSDLGFSRGALTCAPPAWRDARGAKAPGPRAAGNVPLSARLHT